MGRQASRQGARRGSRRRGRRADQLEAVRIRDEIATHGVAVVEGRLRLGGRSWRTHYTVGLTRHEGHPEIIVVGECCQCTEAILLGAADRVREGVRLGAGWGLRVEGWLHVLIDVDDPEDLPAAQRLYRAAGGRPVPALQAIATDEFGELPWESGIGSELILGPAPRYSGDT